MDSESELKAYYFYPDIYKLELKSASFDELLQLFCVDILQGCSFSDVESILVDYVTSVVEPVGWRAVWRSNKESSVLDLEYDFIVDVVNVSLEKLEADVYVKSVIFDGPNQPLLEELRRKIKVDSLLTVPLIELYTISVDDDDEQFARTATAIEHIRFFTSYIARPWDGDDDDIVYSEKLLKPRLQIYFDMKNNILPKGMVVKIKSILREGWKIQKELNALYTEMHVSDSEAEINEEELIKSMSLKTKLAELQAKMEILENPVIRSFVMKKYVPNKSTKQQEKSSPVVYVVAKEFTYEMLSNLPVKPESVLEFDHNPEAAFKCCSTGDKILIFPGIYHCDTLGWLEGEVIVQGMGSNDKIVLEATGYSDVFLNCCSENIKLQNITLKAKSGLLSALVVHHGRICLQNCTIDCNQANTGILLLGGASALLENCWVCHSSSDAMQMRPLSTLHLYSTHITFNDGNGIQVDVENGSSTRDNTELNIYNSRVSTNCGHGLFFNNVPSRSISAAETYSDHLSYPWLAFQMAESVIVDNKQPDIAVHSPAKPIGNNSSFSPTENFNCPSQEDLNCSIISDLLNEVSFIDSDVPQSCN